MKYKIENLLDNLKLERKSEVQMRNAELAQISRMAICDSFNEMQARVQIALLHDAKIKAIDSVIETVERLVREETYGAGDED